MYSICWTQNHGYLILRQQGGILHQPLPKSVRNFPFYSEPNLYKQAFRGYVRIENCYQWCHYNAAFRSHILPLSHPARLQNELFQARFQHIFARHHWDGHLYLASARNDPIIDLEILHGNEPKQQNPK